MQEKIGDTLFLKPPPPAKTPVTTAAHDHQHNPAADDSDLAMADQLTTRGTRQDQNTPQEPPTRSGARSRSPHLRQLVTGEYVTQAQQIPSIANVIRNIADGIAYASPLTLPTPPGRSCEPPLPWQQPCARSDIDPDHQAIIVNTISAPLHHADQSQGQAGNSVYCEVCRNHSHHTDQCRYKDTILDPTPENLANMDITHADTVTANFCVRRGTILQGEIFQIKTRADWQQLAEEIADRTPTNNLPQNQEDTNHTMIPNDYDHFPIFGPTTVETLQTILNQQLLDSKHQQCAAAITLRYHGFIRKPKPHQGFNTVPLPKINWLSQTFMAALRTSMNDVIFEYPPSCDIPPTSTLTLQAAICQLLVTKGANFRTQIQVNVTETQPNHHAISYSLAFAQNPNYNLTTTIVNEELYDEFIDSTGLCRIPLTTLYTQSDQVLAAATTGDTFITGCRAIATHVLAQCHDTHFVFAKWLLEPGTAHFSVVPDAGLTHMARILASLLQDIMPTNHINNANRTNPQSTYYVNHTDRPLLSIVMSPAYRHNMGRHDQIWNITLHIINTTQNHPNWIEHTTIHPGQRTTDTPASSSNAPAPTVPVQPQHEESSSAPLGQCRIIDAAGATVTQPVQGALRPASSGPTTTKAPPAGVVSKSALPKPSPPLPPEEIIFSA
jgi:hypothetical protein